MNTAALPTRIESKFTIEPNTGCWLWTGAVGEGVVAVHAAKTHCERGHEFAGANLYVTSQGFRQCRTCKKIHWETYKRVHA